MKFNDTLIKLNIADLRVGNIVALIGEAGIGKSSHVKSLAEQLDTKAFSLACNQLADKSDLTGVRLVPRKDGAQYVNEFYPHVVVQNAVDYALENPNETPILHLEEINRTTADVTSSILTFVTERTLGVAELPKNLILMISGNDKGNVVALDDASISRFVLYNVEPDAQRFMEVIGDALHPFIREVLTADESLILCKPSEMLAVDGRDDEDDDDGDVTVSVSELDSYEEMNQFTTPRTLDYLSRWLHQFSDDDLRSLIAESAELRDRQISVLQEAIEGHVGRTPFVDALMGVIAKALSSNTPTQRTSSAGVPRPGCYDSLINAGSVTDMNAQIQQLNDHEVSGAIVYAMQDNSTPANVLTVLTEQLAAKIDRLEPSDSTIFATILTNGEAKSEIVDAAVGAGTTLSTRLKALRDAL